MASDHDQDGRELDELRQSFVEASTQMGWPVETDWRNEDGTGQQPPPAAAGPAAPPDRPAGRNLVVVIMAASLLFGGVVGYLAHQPAAAPSRPPVTSAPRPRVVAPVACLETARRGDQVLDMLFRNVRDRRMSLAFKAYTEASQACRKRVSP